MTSEMAPLRPAVHAANTLTGRWCARVGGRDFVLSGAGLWPLLALLASAADESAGAELAAALGRPADCAQREALEVLEVLRGGVSTSAALGIWTREDVPLQVDWAAGLPAGVVRTLTDQAALDRWADEQTGGLIEKFPFEITAETLLVLASALAARVRWRTPFDSYPRGDAGGRSIDDLGSPDQQWLSRRTSDLMAAVVLDGSVTRVVVESDGDVDVHLLLGDQEAADVLAVGLRELSGAAEVCPAAELDSGGPGFTVRRERSRHEHDQLQLSLPSFEIKARHDLLEHADLFGLGLLADASVPHLPLLSPVPLRVSGGVQEVLARFFAEGFEAAAISGFDVRLAGFFEEQFEVTVVDVRIDRPFGILAVHRPSRLAVVAGWVQSPFQPGP